MLVRSIVVAVYINYRLAVIVRHLCGMRAYRLLCFGLNMLVGIWVRFYVVFLGGLLVQDKGVSEVSGPTL